MSEMMNQARLDYHIIVLTKLVKGAVKSDGGKFECGTCRGQHVEWNKVPHPDNCPVSDLQRLIDGTASPEITERNYRLANQRLNQALDNIHELVKSDPRTNSLTNVEIIDTVREITRVLVGDQKRRKDDG